MKQIKLLYVAILGIVVGDAECAQQTVFDLPLDTPGLQISVQNKTVNGIQNQKCIHVIVPGTDADNAYHDRNLRPINAKERVDYATSKIGNIYFPRNGAQPTTPEAVEYSCANVGVYDINHPITEWYLRMFGWIPEDDTKDGAAYDHIDRLKVGFDKETNPKPLLLMPFNLVKNDNIFLDNRLSLTKRLSFWHFFRYIASSPVGRVLLYRLLIEVRRIKNGKGSVCNDVTMSQVYTNERNENRHLILEWRDCNCFSKDNNRLGFCCTNLVALQCITEDVKDGNVLILPYCSWFALYVDISIFHELCHWFHFLRNPDRYTLEKTAGNNTILINGKTYNEIPKIPLAQYIYGEVYANDKHKEGWRVSALPWRESNHVHFEELRNIIGSTSAVNSYLEGDDLSENLYRLSLGQPLRFGHSNEIYRESETIVNKAKNIAICNAHLFGLTILNLTVPSVFSAFVKVPTLNLDGLNHCKYNENNLLYNSDLMFPRRNI